MALSSGDGALGAFVSIGSLGGSNDWLVGLHMDKPKTMDDASEFRAYVADKMPAIDRELASVDEPIWNRPFRAALIFVSVFVLEVGNADGTSGAPDFSAGFASTKTFRNIYREISDWYRLKHPGVIGRKPDDKALGVVSIEDTMHRIRIPVFKTRAGRVGETYFLSYPTDIEPDENPRDWIELPPTWSMVTQSQLEKVDKRASRVARSLRVIRTGITGIPNGSVARGLTTGIFPFLEQAAEKLASERPGSVPEVYWDLQMAVERAMKFLQTQLKGEFKKTHDLYVLYDEMGWKKPAFDRDLLACLPHWMDGADLRYGLQDQTDRRDCYGSYEGALTIIAATVKAMRKMELGNVSIEIGRPPWLSSDDCADQ
jgi:hypothetical protein